MKIYRVTIKQNDFHPDIFYVKTIAEVCTILTGCPLDLSVASVVDLSDMIMIQIVDRPPEFLADLEKFPGWKITYHLKGQHPAGGER